jgi:ribonuclease Z
MASHKIIEKTIDKQFTICGYSVAGEETVVAVPELDVCFDIGKSPEQFIPINNVLVSHGHIDHISGLAYHLSHRQFCGQKAGNVYAHPELIGPIGQILTAWGVLDGSPIKANLIEVNAGSEFKIKPNIFARVFQTYHNRTSLGYTILERRKKLKPEFSGLNGKEIVKLKKEGTEIENIIEIPLVTYLGDTAACDYSHLDFVKNSRVLITECTFYMDDNSERAKAGKHTHVKQLREMLEKLNNEHVVIIHISQRTSIREAKAKLKQHLSGEIWNKTILLMDLYPQRQSRE